jgi:ribosome-binding factor A
MQLFIFYITTVQSTTDHYDATIYIAHYHSPVQFRSLECNYLYCTLTQYSFVQITRMQLFILYITTVQCSTDHFDATICIVHYHSAVQYRSLRYNYLYCTLSQSSAVQVTTVQIFVLYITTYHCSTDHYDTTICIVHYHSPMQYRSLGCKYLYFTLPQSSAVQITRIQLFIFYITTVQCNADHYDATIYIVHYHSPVRYRSLRCNYLCCNLPQSSAVEFTRMHVFTLYITTVLCSTDHYDTINYFYINTFQCNTDHYDATIYIELYHSSDQ